MSQAYDHNTARNGDANRLLPFHAVSYIGVVALLARWVAMPGNKGGFRDPAHKRAAEELLDAFVALVSEGEGVVFDLRVDESEVWSWPRPLQGRRPCLLRLRAGMLDISEMQRVQRSVADAETCRAKFWVAELLEDGQTQVLFKTVLSSLMRFSSSSGHPLLTKLLVGLGMTLDQVVLRLADGDDCARADYISDDEEDLTRFQRLMAANGHLTHWSLCTDKVRVGDLDFCASYCLLPDGHCVELFPQVARRCGRSSSLTLSIFHPHVTTFGCVVDVCGGLSFFCM